MARQISDIKEFLELTRRADIKKATIKVNVKHVRVSSTVRKAKTLRQTKFKVRGSKTLYTLTVNDAAKAKKLIQALPPTLEVLKL